MWLVCRVSVSGDAPTAGPAEDVSGVTIKLCVAGGQFVDSTFTKFKYTDFFL